MMKKKLVFALLIIVLIPLIYFISMRDNTIKIGFAGGLSGRWSQLSIDTRNGFILAIEEINSSGGLLGKEIVPYFYDDQSDVQKGIELGKSFKEDDIEIVVGFSISQMRRAVVEIMRNQNIIFISPTMTTNNLSEIDDYFFRVIPENTIQAETMLSYMENQNKKKLVILYNTNNYENSITLLTHFKNLSMAYGVRVVDTIGIDSTLLTNSDIVARINSTSCDSIFFITNSIDTANLAQILKINDINLPLYSSSWAKTSDLIENGGNSIENMTIVGYFDMNSTSPKYIDFSEKIYNKFGTDVSYATILGYEAVEVIRNAVEESNSTDPNVLKQTIPKIGEYDGVLGPFNIDLLGDSQRPPILFKIKNGKYVNINYDFNK